MTINQEMAHRAQSGARGDAVRVIPGDDITKAAWRFERRVLETPLEQSEAWPTFALRNNILDPFQIASSDSVQYAVPVTSQVFISNGAENAVIDLSEYEDQAIVRVDIYNEYLGAHLFMRSTTFKLGTDAAISEYELTLSIGKDVNGYSVSVVTLDPNISYEVWVDLIPFRPREMSIPTGDIIESGSILYTIAYPASGVPDDY